MKSDLSAKEAAALRVRRIRAKNRRRILATLRAMRRDGRLPSDILDVLK